MELLGIPYFTFRNVPTNNFVLFRVYANEETFEKLSFAIEETKVFIFSSKYPGRRLAIIRLPTKITKSASEVSLDERVISSSFRCYRLLLRIKEDHNEATLTDLDVISKFLSWSHDYQEEPFTLSTYQSNSEDDLAKLLLKKLTLKEITENAIEKSKDNVNCYGFASRYTNELIKSEVNWQNIIDCDCPDSSDQKTRYLARWENERQSFDVDHYLADYFFENDDISNSVWLGDYLNYHPYWEKNKSPSDKMLTPNQMKILATLPCKNFKLSSLERVEVLHSLFDIILAYAYDYRLNGGVFNSESAWNISKLSSTLSWLQAFKYPKDVIISFFRRSLTYPLMRHLAMSKKVLHDAIFIFYLGRRQILNCLVSIYELFEDDDDRKIFNKLYIEDYLIWIQQVHPKTLENYVKLIESCKQVDKGDVFSTLSKIECAAFKILSESDSVQFEKWDERAKQVALIIE